MESQPVLTKRERVIAIRETLVERFPKCFRPKGTLKLPLAIGIRDMIIARCPELPEADIHLALRDYTRGMHTYRSQMFYGANRIGLDGEVCGQVLLEHAEMAGIDLMEAGFPALAAAIALSVNRQAAA